MEGNEKKRDHMHVVSDIQQRPKKGRLKCEKKIISLYDLCTLAQLICFLIHTTSFTMASRRTFVHSVWTRNPLELVPALQTKTQFCQYQAVWPTLYAFKNVSVALTADNANNIFADNANQMFLAIFFSGVALLLGVVNRLMVDANFFSVHWRNFTLRKDLISATEIAMLCLVLRTALMANTSRLLLSDYLRHCGLSEIYLPFCSVVPMFIFVGVGYFLYLLGSVVYLRNALPKYGIMTEAEIADYKVWLRNRRDRMKEAKRMANEAREANMRLQLMIRADSMPPPRDAAPNEYPINRHNTSMHQGKETVFAPDVSTSYNMHSFSMPQRRDVLPASQQQQQQQEQMLERSFRNTNTPLYASYVTRPST